MKPAAHNPYKDSSSKWNLLLIIPIKTYILWGPANVLQIDNM